MRKAAKIAAVVVFAVLLLAVLLPRLVSLDSLKPRIVALLEEKTGRKVSFSKITLSLLPGIGVRVTGLTVSGDPGHPEERLLSVPDAEVRVALGPLLAGRVEFGRLILRRPEVLFRKYKDGTHSGTQISDRLRRMRGPFPGRRRRSRSPFRRSPSRRRSSYWPWREKTSGRPAGRSIPSPAA